MFFHALTRLPRRIVRGMIWIYQHTLSPDHGPLKGVFEYGVCRFRPTCSAYMSEAVGKYGVFAGGWMGIKRIGRCHPWHPGGIDEVP